MNMTKCCIGMLSLLLFGAVCLLSACAPASEAYKEAFRSKNPKKLEVFIRKYPDSQYAVQARNLLARHDLSEADKAGNLEAYQKLLKKYHDFPVTLKLIKQRIEDLEFQAARKEDSIAAYQAFVAKHPFGRKRSMAEAKIDSIRLKEAEQQNTIEAYQTYLAKAETKGNVKRAKQNLAKLTYEKALAEDTEQALEKFIAEFPDSEMAVKASERLLNMRLPGTLYFSKQGYVSMQWGKVSAISPTSLTAAYGVEQKQNFTLSAETKICSKAKTRLRGKDLQLEQEITIATIPEKNKKTAIAIYLGTTKSTFKKTAQGETEETEFTEFPTCFPLVSAM